MPLSNLAGLPLKIDRKVLALEENDVSVVFIDFSVGVGPPKFLNFICSFVLFFLQIKSRLHIILLKGIPQKLLSIQFLSICFKRR